MAARPYSSAIGVPFDNTISTAILHCNRNYAYYASSPSSPSLPYLPHHNYTHAAFYFFKRIGGLPGTYSQKFPLNISTHIVNTLSTHPFPCPKGQSCEGPNKIASSLNNDFENLSIEILEACFYHISEFFTRDFPILLPQLFDLIAKYLPLVLEILEPGTKVEVLKYGPRVELVLQGTNLVAGMDHPMYLTGYSVHVVGYVFGNVDKDKDPMKYNLIDSPLLNTVPVPKNGWAAIRFNANNQGVWFTHCLLNRSLSRGMEIVSVVKNGGAQIKRYHLHHKTYRLVEEHFGVRDW